MGAVRPVLLAALGGCNSLFPACTDIEILALSVSAVDSVSGARVAGDALVIATEGAYADTATLTATAPWAAVGLVPERAGVYTVRVTADGYASWERRDVRVTRTSDGCHVETVSLTARLTR